MIKLMGFAVLIAASGSHSNAAPPAEQEQVLITVSAQDMAKPRAMAVLKKRIGVAVEQFCGSFASVEYDQWRHIDRCREDALRGVEQQMAKLAPNGAIRLALAR